MWRIKFLYRINCQLVLTRQCIRRCRRNTTNGKTRKQKFYRVKRFIFRENFRRSEDTYRLILRLEIVLVLKSAISVRNSFRPLFRYGIEFDIVYNGFWAWVLEWFHLLPTRHVKLKSVNRAEYISNGLIRGPHTQIYWKKNVFYYLDYSLPEDKAEKWRNIYPNVVMTRKLRNFFY